MITYLQSILLGILQGATELFPISSLGHTVLIPALLHWRIDESSDSFLAFLILTHLATALVLIGFFYREWWAMSKGLWRTIVSRRIDPSDSPANFALLLILGTIPAGLLGLLFEKKLRLIFTSPSIIAGALLLNGLILLGAELLRRNSTTSDMPQSESGLGTLTWRQSLSIGLAQCLALIPGFSRTGVTMTAGLLNNLTHRDAAQFSFYLATPIILAAAALKVPGLFMHHTSGLLIAFVGAFCAALTAYLSLKFLVQYFKTNTLTPFAWYCIVTGIGALVYLHI